MRRVALALALLATLGIASAQQWSGGVHYRLGGDLTASATVEWPSFDLLGLRAGPSVAVRAHAGPGGYGASVFGGVTIAFVTGLDALPALALDIIYEAVYRSGDAARYGPTIALYAAGSF